MQILHHNILLNASKNPSQLPLFFLSRNQVTRVAIIHTATIQSKGSRTRLNPIKCYLISVSQRP